VKKLLIVPVIGVVVGLSILINVGIELAKSRQTPRFNPADDGTPCYTYLGTLDCNFPRANKETQFGKFPYAIKEGK